jgi:hypothetical protein
MVHFRGLFVELLGDAAETGDRADRDAEAPRTTRNENVREMR